MRKLESFYRYKTCDISFYIVCSQDCSHCKYKNTNDERWTHQLIILAAEQACNGIYNFIVPLRSQFIGMKSLCPIILLLEEP